MNAGIRARQCQAEYLLMRASSRAGNWSFRQGRDRNPFRVGLVSVHGGGSRSSILSHLPWKDRIPGHAGNFENSPVRPQLLVVSVRVEAGGSPGQARLQCPSIYVWAGSGGGPVWASPQQQRAGIIPRMGFRQGQVWCRLAQLTSSHDCRDEANHVELSCSTYWHTRDPGLVAWLVGKLQGLSR